MMRIFYRTCLIAVLAAGANVGAGAQAQSYPTKPIRLLTAEPGGGSDFAARLIAQRLTESLGQQIVVDNRVGGVIIGELAAKAQPDGYTITLYSNGLWLVPLMRSRTPYDTTRDFVPVSLVATSPAILVVPPSLPVKSTEELIALVKSKPGDLNYASGPAGATPHLAGELFKYMAGANVVHIPFKGVGLALNDVIAGRVQMMFSPLGSGLPQVKAGRLKILAVTSAQPSALLPGVTTVAAAGLPGYEATSIFGMLLPAKTPRDIVQRLSTEITRAVQRPDIKEKFLNVSIEAAGSTPEQFAQIIRTDIERMGKVIKAANIRAE